MLQWRLHDDVHHRSLGELHQPEAAAVHRDAVGDLPVGGEVGVEVVGGRRRDQPADEDLRR